MYVWLMNDQLLAQILPASFAVVGTLGGAGLAAFINRWNTNDTLASARIASEEQWVRTLEHSHDVWLRDKKQEAYAEFCTVAEDLYEEAMTAPSLLKELSMKELSVKRGMIKLVGSAEVRLLALKLKHALHYTVNTQHVFAQQFATMEADEPAEVTAERLESLETFYKASERAATLLTELVEAMREDLETSNEDDGVRDDALLLLRAAKTGRPPLGGKDKDFIETE